MQQLNNILLFPPQCVDRLYPGMSAGASRRMFGHRIFASLMAHVTAALETLVAALLAFHPRDKRACSTALNQAGSHACLSMLASEKPSSRSGG